MWTFLKAFYLINLIRQIKKFLVIEICFFESINLFLRFITKIIAGDTKQTMLIKYFISKLSKSKNSDAMKKNKYVKKQ